MRVKIEFRIDNAAFVAEGKTYDWEAVAEIITSIAPRVRNGYLSGAVNDFNGNLIGKYSVDY